MATATTQHPQRHIAIVGGGIIGSCTAFFLTRHPAYARPSTKLTLIEGTAIAAGASGKAGGLLALDWHGESTSSLAALSYSLHASLASTYDGPKRWQYRPLSTLSISADFTPSSSSSPPKRQAGKKGDQLGWLDEKVLRGTQVLGTEQSTAQVHPSLFTHAMAEMAQDDGVELVHGTVQGLIRHTPATPDGKQTFTLQLASSAEIANITDVVLCAGPWTGSLARKLGLNAGKASGINGSRAHSIVLQPSPTATHDTEATGDDSATILPAQALFTNIKERRGKFSEPEIYNRPDNTAYCCGPTDFSALPPTAGDVVTDPKAIATLRDQITTLSPLLAKAETVAEQACYLPVGSKTGDPVIGELEKGVWVASGHSCWGICNGPGTGKCLAELLLDGKVSSANIDKLKP